MFSTDRSARPEHRGICPPGVGSLWAMGRQLHWHCQCLCHREIRGDHWFMAEGKVYDVFKVYMEWNKHVLVVVVNVICLCVCGWVHARTHWQKFGLCFGFLLWLIGYVLQFQEKHAEEYIIFIIIISNLAWGKNAQVLLVLIWMFPMLNCPVAVRDD